MKQETDKLEQKLDSGEIIYWYLKRHELDGNEIELRVANKLGDTNYIFTMLPDGKITRAGYVSSSFGLKKTKKDTVKVRTE